MGASESDIVAVRVIYSGHVQGVGFRFSTLDIARGFELDGFVRNLSDGTVELAARGSTAQVEQFLAAIKQRMGSYITDDYRADASTDGDWPSPFEIRM